MRRFLVVLALAFCLAPASAAAHPVTPSPKATSNTAPCSKLYTVREYRTYASRVYRRARVTDSAQRRMAAMHGCQHSRRALRAVARWHRTYVQRRERLKWRWTLERIIAPYRGWLASVRACESGGNYAINTGNGFYGAYQFTLSSWRAVGGAGMPHHAPPLEQDFRAVRLRHLQGVGAWPNCG